jgi:hypothetical protein
LSVESLTPIRYERSLRCSADHAFAVDTGRIGEWWDPLYTANPESLRAGDWLVLLDRFRAVAEGRSIT